MVEITNSLCTYSLELLEFELWDITLMGINKCNEGV